MTCEVIDFSEAYFLIFRKESIPGKRSGKFVLVQSPESEFIVLAPYGMLSFHAKIVERFCQLRNLDGQFVKGSRGHDVFRIDVDHWRVAGGGHWEIDDEQQTVRVYGTSDAYGGVDLPVVGERLQHQFPRYSISCE